MTPKEKAKELVEKIGNIQLYIDIEPRNIEGKIKYFDEDLIKECALIAVDEIIKSNPCYEDSDRGGNFQWNDNTYYWQEVKNEINKL